MGWVGNDSAAGPSSTLFFTAGPFDEGHGLFGTLTAVQQGEDEGTTTKGTTINDAN